MSQTGSWIRTTLDELVEGKGKPILICMSTDEAETLSGFGLIMGKEFETRIVDRLVHLHDYPHRYVYPYDPIAINHLL